MKLITVGEKAPDFSLKDNHGKTIHLSDYKGKKVLLSWHPLAWTSVCTDQMRALESNWNKFQSLNTVPIGLSVDAPPCKKAWGAVLLLNNLTIPSDFWPHGKVSTDYGIFIEEKGMSERANIIVDENGIVKWVKVYPMKDLPDINEVFEVLSKMK
ncbi:MAG: peroxiredoxin [Lutisporaceae bacterium]